MKKLILVRHAKASYENTFLQDYDRPLQKSGIEDIKKIGQYLKLKKHTPDYILTSGARRTRESAKFLSHLLFNKPISIHENRMIYEADVKQMIGIIESLDNQYKTVMIIGHNPTMTFLNNQISNANINHMPTSATTIINFEIENWKDFKFSGELIEFIYPKKLNLN